MKKKCMALILVISLVFLGQTNTANARNDYYDYYGSGNYASSAPYTPVNGLRFYVDYYAISEFGSGPFTSGFDWNGDYQANVAAIAQYPASASSYPDYFTISVDSLLLGDTYGITLFYDSNGNYIDEHLVVPMDTSGIYRCRINLNVFEAFDEDYAEARRTIVHEIGHVFLLKHPSTVQYFASVMIPGSIGAQDGRVTATVTSTDRDNLEDKWGR